MQNLQLARIQADSSVEDAVAIIMRDGGVIVEGLFSASTIAGLTADLEPQLEAVDYGYDPEFAGSRTRRLGGLFGRSKHMVDVAMNPLYRGIAEVIINKPLDIWFGGSQSHVKPGLQVGVTQAIQIAPGQGAQPLHRDDLLWLWRHPDYKREARLQIMVAVTDFTEENGGTLVIPRSHLWDDERQPAFEEAVPTEMSAGSALIWIGSTYHGGGTNSGASYRFGLTMAYDMGTLKAEENHFLSLSLETMRSLPEELQRSLGWTAGENYAGWVEVAGQMADPQRLLESENYTSIDAGLPKSF